MKIHISKADLRCSNIVKTCDMYYLVVPCDGYNTNTIRDSKGFYFKLYNISGGGYMAGNFNGEIEIVGNLSITAYSVITQCLKITVK